MAEVGQEASGTSKTICSCREVKIPFPCLESNTDSSVMLPIAQSKAKQ
jgi:hypothetical protein